MENMVDMHIHSLNSDGEYAVGDLVNMIRGAGVNLFSITDHDCIESINDVSMINLGDLNYTPGVEISAIYKGLKMHVLAYNFEVNDALELMLKSIQEKRLERFYKMVYLIEKEEGIKIPSDVLESVMSKSSSIGRPQIINALMRLGYGGNREYVYRNLVKPYKSKVNYRKSLEEVIDVLKECHASIILAHPKEIEDEHNIDIESVLPQLLDLGVDGIEVFNSIHSLSDIKRYYDLVNRYNLCYTAGSDYHGPNVKPTVKVGVCSSDGIKVRQISLNK